MPDPSHLLPNFEQVRKAAPETAVEVSLTRQEAAVVLTALGDWLIRSKDGPHHLDSAARNVARKLYAAMGVPWEEEQEVSDA